MSEYLVKYAEQEIASTYGDEVSVGAKRKALHKFGRNAAVGTSYETVWEYGGDETYATTNAIDKISSSDNADTAVIFVEGHTVSGTGADAQFTFTTQLVTLTGQTAATLTTPLARCSRAYVYSGTIAGDIYIHESDTLTAGVPQTASKVHATIQGASGNTQTFKAATTFSNTDYFICTGGWAAVDKKTTATVDFLLEVKRPGGVFRPATGRLAASSSGAATVPVTFTPYVIVPKNSDIRVRAISSAADTEVDVVFEGFLATVI